MTLLKPLSAAIAIGTGGPFGAEGPIIATGGALGSLVRAAAAGSPPDERKTLLAAGAAAGMSATFGSPVAAVLLAIELLLFEYRPRSVIPVALAATTATRGAPAAGHTAPAFEMPAVAPSTGPALASTSCSAPRWASRRWARPARSTRSRRRSSGCRSTGCGGRRSAPSRSASLALRAADAGGRVRNIDDILSGRLALAALVSLSLFKFISWSIALGSGTSGGTLAPLFTIGGGLGAILGLAATALLPGLGVDPRVAGLVGMAAIFAGASRALLASGRLRLRDDPAADGAAAAARRLQRGLPRLQPADAALHHDGEDRLAAARA